MDLDEQPGYAQDQLLSSFFDPHLVISLALGDTLRGNSDTLCKELAFDSATEAARDFRNFQASSGERYAVEVREGANGGKSG